MFELIEVLCWTVNSGVQRSIGGEANEIQRIELIVLVIDWVTSGMVILSEKPDKEKHTNATYAKWKLKNVQTKRKNIFIY